jgi:hypothetical protein
VPFSSIALSQRRVREAQYYRIVDIRAHDRKNYDDNRPRIRRRNDLLVPMQQVVMDVKVIDCLVRRSDGTTAWPRMVAYMDTATQRIFRRFFLLNAGEAIRQEHVAQTFLDMVHDPAWGFPQQLYRDNGSEFFILDMIRSALDQLGSGDVSTIINARPYCAASKPIESKFAVLDRFVFSQIAGWAGGDRMRKKTAVLGKPPLPYQGSFADFVREANERIDVFETHPIRSGPFQGKSPRELLHYHLARGWRPLLVNTERLDAAFCTLVTRGVSRGTIKLAGVRYRHPKLVHGMRLTVAVPWRRGSLPLVQIPDQGWDRLLEDTAFLPTDPTGPLESAKRQREYEAVTRSLRQRAGEIDLEANRRERLAGIARDVCDLPCMIDADILPGEQGLASALTEEPQGALARDPPPSYHRQAETADLENYLASTRI